MVRLGRNLSGTLYPHVTSGTITSGTQSNSLNYPKPNVHISQLIAAANQKANPEVTVQEMTRHSLYTPTTPQIFSGRLHLPKYLC